MLKKIIAGLTTAAVLAGMSTAVMAARNETPSGIPIDEVGSRIEQWASENENEYPSFAVAVVNGGDLVYSGAFGYIDIGNGIEATPDDTVYEWGSCSKTLVWVSVMQLWEQGRIDLNEDIRNYLPEDFFHNLRYDDPITMLNLMNHNAGWGESTWAMQVTDENDIMDLGEALQYSEPVQMYRPGEVASYSNYGAALAGYVVECITGQSYEDYVHEHIFDVLGMEHTAIAPAHNDNEWVYERRQQFVNYQRAGDSWVSNGHQLCFILPYPAGAACGTIEDMALYCSELVSDENPLFENESTRDELFSATMFCGSTDIASCCHGFWLADYEYASTLGHNGGTNGGSANLEFDPVSGIGVVTLMNGSGNPHHAMDELVFGDPVIQIPETTCGYLSSQDLSGLCISARSWRRGPLRFMSMLGLMPITRVSEDEYDVAGMYTITRFAEDAFYLQDDSVGMAAEYKVLDDGTRVFDIASSGYVTEKGLAAELILMCLYVLIVLAAAVLLIIKLIRVIAGKNKPYEGSKIITAAQIAKIVSAGVIGFWLSVLNEQYGLYKPQGVIGCFVQMLCFAVCLASAFVSVKALTKGGKGKFKYIVNVLGNVSFAAAMVVFELMRFWSV